MVAVDIFVYGIVFALLLLIVVLFLLLRRTVVGFKEGYKGNR